MICNVKLTRKTFSHYDHWISFDILKKPHLRFALFIPHPFKARELRSWCFDAHTSTTLASFKCEVLPHYSKRSHSQPPSVADIGELLPAAWVTSIIERYAVTTAAKQTWRRSKFTHTHLQPIYITVTSLDTCTGQSWSDLEEKTYGTERLDYMSEFRWSAGVRPRCTDEESLP